MTAGDESGLVRRGYDALSYQYRSDDAGEDEYAPWLAELRAVQEFVPEGDRGHELFWARRAPGAGLTRRNLLLPEPATAPRGPAARAG